jgi:hypothetical protein
MNYATDFYDFAHSIARFFSRVGNAEPVLVINAKISITSRR